MKGPATSAPQPPVPPPEPGVPRQGTSGAPAPGKSPGPAVEPAHRHGLPFGLPARLLWLPYRYGVVVLIVLAAAAVRMAFMQGLGGRAPYVTFFPAVMLAALYAGLGGGLLAAALSACLADFFWIEPVGSFAIHDPADWLGMASFLAGCTMISWIVEAMQRARARAREAEAKFARLPAQPEPGLWAGQERLPMEQLKALLRVKAVFGVAIAILVAVAWGAYRDIASMLEQGSTESELADARALLQTGVVGGLLGLGLLLLAFRLLRKEILHRTQAEGELRAHRDHLEDLVQARTAELEAQVAERRRAEEALSESRERLNLALSSSGMAAFDWDILKNQRTWGAGVHRLLGTKPETFTGTTKEFFDIIHPQDRDAVEWALWKAVHESGLYEVEYRAVHPDGSTRQIAARGRIQRDRTGRAVRLTGVCWDITEDKRREQELQRLNRTLKALRDSSHAMTRAEHEPEYLEQVCKIVVEDCGHAMVWIGLAQEDAARSVRPVAHAGLEAGYLQTMNISWADTERGRGPTGTAIRTGKPAACREMLTDPAFAPWREEALKRGYASSLALPLMANGKAFGVITLYSREPDPFSEDEVKLLGQLADDLAYGIETIRLRQAHARSRAELEVLLREIHHRVKNNLQVIASLVDIQTNNLDDPVLRARFQNVRDRVRSMALVHEKLYQSESLARVEFADYARSLFSYLCRAHGSPQAGVALKLDLQPLSLSVEKAVPCGLILNELVTNALKHAFRGRATGEIAAALSASADGWVRLRVSDNGVGLPAGMKWRESPSLGLRLIHLLAGQLSARVEVEVPAGGGTAFLIVFPQSQT